MIKASSARYYEIQGPNNSKLFYPTTPTLNKRSELGLFFSFIGGLMKNFEIFTYQNLPILSVQFVEF